MSFSGGSFTVTNGVHSGSTTWQQDRDAGTPIKADRMDYALTDIATGLSKCVLKDGTQTITANLPMNDTKLTGLGDGSSRTDSVALKQVQDNAFNYAGVTTGAAGTFAGTLAPAISAYAGGAIYTFRAHQAANGSDLLNLNGVGTKSIVRTDGTALVAGDLVANKPAAVIYDSTLDKFILINPGSTNANLAAIAALAVTDSNIIVGNGSTWVAETGATARTSLGAAASGTNADITHMTGLIEETGWTPTVASSPGTIGSVSSTAKWWKLGEKLRAIVLTVQGVTASNDTEITATLPEGTASGRQGGGCTLVTNASAYVAGHWYMDSGQDKIKIQRIDGSVFTNGTWQFNVNAIYFMT
jgi:hypothetical protein